jgi:serine/threonine-protein kinase HipA
MISKELAVFAYLPDEVFDVPAGLLSLSEEGANSIGASFVYGSRYMARPNAIEIDPVSLSLREKDNLIGAELHPAPGLSIFGAIRDAAPDAWGRRVIESKRKIPINSLPESEYLLAAGSNRVGAIDVRLDIKSSATHGMLSDIHSLEYLIEAAQRIEEGLPIPVRLENIFDAGTALGGARPKATVTDEQGKLWMAKFPSKFDGYNIPLVETATLRLAKLAGIRIPELKDPVILAKGTHVMLIERFDRVGAGKAMTRKHFISALTLLGCHESDSPQKNYTDIADAMRKYGAAPMLADNLKELFSRMVFNILVTNDDDHLRNHGMLWVPQHHAWELSPLYDVVPKPTHATERFLHLGIGQQGRLATLDNALSWYTRFGLTRGGAIEIINHVWSIVREWEGYFEGFGVSSSEIDKIRSAFRHARDIGGKEIGLF